MKNALEIVTKLRNIEILEKGLENLVYGSIEIREKDSRKYIYVHYRVDGILKTRYVDEYSEEVCNNILNNTVKAKEIKKKIRSLRKELKNLGYVAEDISQKVAFNIDFAKRNLIETIYKQAILEGVATTYADTETIITGGKVNNMTADDIMKIVNLKHAWDFILSKDIINYPTDFSLLCTINRLVEQGFYYNAGLVRSIPVGIGGTNWKPELPIESVIKEELHNILNSDLSIVDKAIETLLFVMKKQIFIDGNKRTAIIFANHLLITNACGLIVIPNEKIEEYRKLLITYYEGKDNIVIKNFFKKHFYLKLND